MEIGGTALVRSLSFIRLIVLARLFLPEEYGGYSTGLILLAPTLLIVGPGFSQSVIKARDERLPEAFWTAFLLSGGLAILVAAALAVSGPLWARLFSDPALSGVLLLLSLAVLEAPATLPLALLDRHLLFARSKAVEGASVLAGLVAVVTMDAVGVSPVLAMASGHVVTVLSRGGALWILARPLPPFAVSGDEARKQLRFCLPLMGSGLFAFIAARGDDLGVRWFDGAEALGLYSLAFYSTAVLHEVSVALDRVSLPIFARVGRGDALRESFIDSLRLMVLLTLPVGVAVAVFSRPLVAFAFGTEWLAAAPLLSILAVAFGMKAATGVNWNALAYRADETRTMAWVTVVEAALMVGVGVPMIWWLGPVGGAWYTLVFVLVLSPALRLPMMRRVLGDVRFLSVSLPPVIAMTALGSAAWAMGSQRLDPLPGVMAFGVFLVAAYAVVLAVDPGARATVAALRPDGARGGDSV